MKKAIFCVLALTLGCGSIFGQAYKVLYNFGTNGRGQDAITPNGGLVFDTAGNAYGTSQAGGAGYGTVFELSPLPDGSWTEKLIHTFCQAGPPCLDGGEPWDGLVIDSNGNLYGTTVYGGDGSFSDGTVFEMSPQADGTWAETLIWSFSGADGALPFSKLTFDKYGNLYGTASLGGFYGDGTVFELTPGLSGWTIDTLNSFSSQVDGCVLYAPVAIDKEGNLYGATYKSGIGCTSQGGMLFELSPAVEGWAETLLPLFAYSPWGAPTLNGKGNQMYVTLANGGPDSWGTITRLIDPSGRWLQTRSFFFNGTDGKFPESGVPLDEANQAAYGSTYGGGTGGFCNDSANGCGTVYKLQPGKRQVLHSFCSKANCADGEKPFRDLTTDKHGRLYGTATEGGTYGWGVAFELIP